MTTPTARTIRFILAGAMAALPATATMITFSLSADGTGTLGSTPFTNALITFTQVTDTTLIGNGCGVLCAPQVTTNTVTIAGVGTVTLTDETFFFNNEGNVIGLEDITGGQFPIGALSGSLGGYNMKVNFGPLPYPVFVASFSGEPTTGGLLAAVYSGQVTFQAVVGSTSSTPEPGSFGLALAGAISLAAGLLRRRRR
jgi:MYXO-CTERM domain-containing protein